MTISEQKQKRHSEIKAGFVVQGTSLHAWCQANNIWPQNAQRALIGKWTGPKADELIGRIMNASGVSKE